MGITARFHARTEISRVERLPRSTGQTVFKTLADIRQFCKVRSCHAPQYAHDSDIEHVPVDRRAPGLRFSGKNVESRFR